MPEEPQTQAGLPEIRITQSVGRRMFTLWREELDITNARSVESGHVKLDAVPSPPPRQRTRGSHTEHAMDGSTVIVWYIAGREATQRAIREASEATEMMHLPRHLYVGKIIDVLWNQGGQAYIVCRTITRRDSGSGHAAFRAFNPYVGNFVEMIINPSEETTAAEMARNRTARQAPRPEPPQVPGAAETIERVAFSPRPRRRNLRRRRG
jgi:hypothetical protein